jgi:putative membrane protein
MLNMKNLSGYSLLFGLALICFNCQNGQQNAVKEAKDSNARTMDSSAVSGNPATKVVPVSVSKEDAKFVVDAAAGGMEEVQLGQLAQQKGMAQDVKAFGAMMERDHTRAGDRLTALAKDKNIVLPSAISPDMQKIADDLQKKDGGNFDRAYIALMVDDHKKDIKEFENESKSGADADIRAFADSSLHMLRTHLDSAESCNKRIKKMSMKLTSDNKPPAGY